MIVDKFFYAARRYGLSTHNKFAHELNRLWRRAGRPQRLGLAISGGVDSMALASLCRDVTNKQSIMAPLFAEPGYPITPVSFVAFTVDHKLRESSGYEALQAAEELHNMGIECEILELDWNAYVPLRNLESVARKLRYQALGTACMKARVHSLLLAHHQDDQAETVMMRILGNYLGAGLAGMQSKANIPHCAGLYGVDGLGLSLFADHSRAGHSEKGIENGGITIWRPLLGLTKDSLIGACVEGGVRWFEDPTNADRTFTLRNTVRSLQRGDVLPSALRSRRLLRIARIAARSNGARTRKAEKFVREMKVVLDLETASARVTIPPTLNDAALKDNLRALYLRYLLLLVAPVHEVALPALDVAVDFVFQPKNSQLHTFRDLAQIQIAGVNIQRDGASGDENLTPAVLLLSRSPPNQAERRNLQLQLWPLGQPTRQSPKIQYQPDWHLWDGRYWISVSPPDTDHSCTEVTARFLSAEDIATIRKTWTGHEQFFLDDRLKRIGTSLRSTLPVIVVKKTSSDNAGVESESVVALPSLGWSVQGWKRSSEKSTDDCWHWDIRYKHVELDKKAPHRIGPIS